MPLYIPIGISSIMNNIWKDFDADINTEFNFQHDFFAQLATCLNCCLISATQALFSLKFNVVFLFKVYTKQNQIRDILTASNMELFVTVAIGNVVFH